MMNECGSTMHVVCVCMYVCDDVGSCMCMFVSIAILELVYACIIQLYMF